VARASRAAAGSLGLARPRAQVSLMDFTSMRVGG
jgi:hypothetical protein